MKYGPESREKPSLASMVLGALTKLILRPKPAPRELMISSQAIAEILRKEKYKDK